MRLRRLASRRQVTEPRRIRVDDERGPIVHLEQKWIVDQEWLVVTMCNVAICIPKDGKDTNEVVTCLLCLGL